MANQPDEARPPTPDEGGTPKPQEAVTPSTVPVAKSGEENLAAASTAAEPVLPEPPAVPPVSGEAAAVPTIHPPPEPAVPEVHAGESGSVPADAHGTDPYHEPHHDSYHELGAHHDDSGHYHADSGGHHDEHGHYHADGGGHHSGGGVVSSGGLPPEPEDPLLGPAEEGGGPIKTFLEHLEDFRWLVIKCASTVMVMMTVCLLGANHLVGIMKWPLKRAAQIVTDQRQYISVEFGPKQVFFFRTTNNAAVPGFLLPTNRYVELEFAPVTLTNSTSTNILLGLNLRKVADELPSDHEMPLVYPNPAAPFIASLKIAFFAGLLLSLPVVIYHILMFIFPALRPRELTYLKKAIYPATLLFIMGISLCYFLILPIALKAAEQYSHWMGVEMLFWHADDYFGFCTKFMLGMGLGFEMPVILLALVKIGLLDYKKLSGFRRYMILINLILGALLTTPEVLTQVMMFFPLQFLYEITIWIAWYWEQPDRALARRRAVGAIIAIILGLVLLGFGIKYGWPWLRQIMTKP